MSILKFNTLQRGSNQWKIQGPKPIFKAVIWILEYQLRYYTFFVLRLFFTYNGKETCDFPLPPFHVLNKVPN